MKRLIGILTMTVVTGAMMVGSALAGSADPVVKQREINQQQRIQQGINNGRLTPAEAGRLEAQQAKIRQDESRMKADGTLTPRERRKLAREQNRASRTIYRKKHNARNVNVQ